MIFDAASFHIVSRPSAWWSDVKSESKISTKVEAKWTKSYGVEGVVNQGMATATMLRKRGCHLFVTAPAPTEQGRDAPINQKKMSTSLPPWLAGGRLFASSPSTCSGTREEQMETASHRDKRDHARDPNELHEGIYRSRQRVGTAKILMLVLLLQGTDRGSRHPNTATCPTVPSACSNTTPVERLQALHASPPHHQPHKASGNRDRHHVGSLARSQPSWETQVVNASNSSQAWKRHWSSVLELKQLRWSAGGKVGKGQA